MKHSVAFLLMLMVTSITFAIGPSNTRSHQQVPVLGPQEFISEEIDAAQKAGLTPLQINEISEDINRKLASLRAKPQVIRPVQEKPKETKKNTPPDVAPFPPDEDEKPVVAKKPIPSQEEEKPVVAPRPRIMRPGEWARAR